MQCKTRFVVVATLALLAGLDAARGQEAPRWSWPERAENLQQLPADFPPERLRAVMTGFTRALGVRCSYCHVGEEGQPLSSYDFPSDDKPMKATARQMLEMLGDINEHLQRIEPSGPERVNMWCHTCHRGQPRPLTLGEALNETYRAEGLEAAVARFRELRDRHYGSAAYDFSERSLNRFGYQLLEAGEVEAAVAILRLNAEQYPESGNVWDSLAEAYLQSGRPEVAGVYYRKALELDPDNANAVAKLRQLAEEQD
jgi:tetratricopeptide (TPR) repeat protein